MKIIKILFFFGLLLFITCEKLDRSKQPGVGASPKIKLPEVIKTKLNNGLEIWTVERHEIPVINVQLLLQAGAASDPKDKPGVANLVASLVTEGTKTKNALEISDAIDFLGANLSVDAGYDVTTFRMQMTSDHLTEGFSILSDLVLNPSFPPKEIDRVKKDLLTELLQEKDEPRIMANKIRSAVLYSSPHPYGRPVTGTERSVPQITQKNLETFYNTYFRPNHSILFVVGDFKTTNLKNLVEENLSSWEPKEIFPLQIGPPPTIKERSVFVYDKPGAAQSEIRICKIGPARTHPDYYKLAVFNSVFGENFSSRLTSNLRETQGYTYGTYSRFVYRQGPGFFSTSGGFHTHVTDSSLIQLFYEIDRIRKEEVAGEEFNRGKAMLTKSLPMEFETGGQIIDHLTEIALFHLPDGYYNGYTSHIEQVRAEEVKSVVDTFLNPDDLSIVIVGDLKTIMEGITRLKLGNIYQVDSEGKIIRSYQ